MLCVTHLAQVAAQADAHFHVAKKSSRNTTDVIITPLADENLVQEISRMLGGNTDKNSAAYKHALELLDHARQK